MRQNKNISFEMQKFGHYINGTFVEPSSGKYIKTVNPATGETLAETASGCTNDVDTAVASAKEAQKNWGNSSITERAVVLQKIAQTIRDNEDYLSYVEALDSGKPIVETVEDIKAIADQFDYFAGVIRSETDECVRPDSTNMTMVLKEPIGIVGQIIPWNFPFLLAGWKIAPALAAGNSIVIKPAEETPLSLLEFARLTDKIIPAGVLNIVMGKGTIVGTAITNHKDIDKIAFTGSTKVGQIIAESAAKNIVPVSLELGGKSANIIFPDAPLEKAIEGAALAILYGQGQVCNAGSRLFVHKSIYVETVEALKAIFMKVKVGNPLDKQTRMGTLISEKQLKQVEAYIELGKQEGAKLVCGGKRLTDEPYSNGWFIEPALFSDADNSMRISQEEIFGPVLVVIPFETEEEVIEMANDSEYGLAGACWTKDISRGLRVANAVETGLFWINEYHLAPSGTPFGGIKKTGYGRENHKMALEEYSRIKTIYISMTEEATGYYD